MTIDYRSDPITAEQFADILRRSGLGERRPVEDLPRLANMLGGADIIITAWDGPDRLVGIARSLSDFSYACYLSDLAVDRDYQGQGIGKRLIEETRKAAGPQSMCLLIAAPDSVSYYQHVGMPRSERAFLFPRET